MESDIRWKQRLNNYEKALGQLQKFIERGDLNPFEEQGLIKSFEYTYELAWNVMKDFFEYQGEVNIGGSRDAIRLAFNRGLVTDGKTWMDMIESRIQTSHTYNEKTAEIISTKVQYEYYPLFTAFGKRMQNERDEE